MIRNSVFAILKYRTLLNISKLNFTVPKPNPEKAEQNFSKAEEDDDAYESSSTKTSLYMFGVTGVFLAAGYMMM